MKYHKETIDILKAGGVGILPTDTMYGIVCRAMDEKAVERIYSLKKRAPAKASIILIADISDLQIFGISPETLLCYSSLQTHLVSIDTEVWPGPVSVILPCVSEGFAYLHRGTESLALRIPQDEDLRTLLRETGPIIAPSANTEGQPPAKTVIEAKEYFGDAVDFYEDAGVLDSLPSTLIEVRDGKVNILRQGVYNIPSHFIKNDVR